MAPARAIVFDGASMLRLVSLGGLFVLIGLCWVFSHDRRAISWRLVGGGLVLQFVLGGVFLWWQAGNDWLWSFGEGVESFLALSQRGAAFVFNGLADRDLMDQALPGAENGFIFATQVLPTLIFFSSFMTVLYHLGVMQVIVRAMATVVAKVLGTSGAETLSACANVFVGQTEAPLMVRPFLGRMTLSEIHTVMTGGFATIAGGVFVIYVGFGIEAGQLMVASVMAVPAGLIASKMLWPERETPDTLGQVRIEVPKVASNTVEAAANGAITGLQLALNVAAMLIAFLGLMAVINVALGWFGTSLEQLLSYLFSPIAAVMGVPWKEVPLLAELLGKKLVLTELVAYSDLGEMIKAGTVSPRTQMIASFALCGFANFGSVAIQIGGLGAMAPERRTDIAKLAFRAMFAGALATCMTACLAGFLKA